MTVPEKNDRISQLSLWYTLSGPGSASKPYCFTVMKQEERRRGGAGSVFFFLSGFFFFYSFL